MDSNSIFVGTWIRTVFSDSHLRLVHAYLFHGRDANSNGGIDTFHSSGSEVTVLDHAIPFLPDIFSPRLNWVVSSRVKKGLSNLDCIAWRPVTFRHVFWMDLDQTSIEWYSRHPGESEENIFNLPESPDRDLYITVPYYELIPVSSWDVVPHCRDQEPAILRLGKDRRKVELPSAVEELLHFPIFTAGGVTFMREEVFASIEHFLDFRFFGKCQVDLRQAL